MASEVKAFVAHHWTPSHLRHGLVHALDLIFPPQVFSHQTQHTLGALDFAMPQPVLQTGLAETAWTRIRFLDGEGCDMCARPFEGLYPGINGLCSACLEKPFPFMRTRAACLYDEASRDIILRFKHADRTDLAPLLSRWIERAGAPLWAEADVLIPVPLHRQRLRERRYNQSAEIVRPLARRLKRRYLPDALIRTRKTAAQAKGAEARWANVRNAFAITPSGAKRIEGKAVVLVDDVFTTGATLRACAQVLLKAGARRVDCVTIARVPRGNDL
jgi:ComF family protein